MCACFCFFFLKEGHDSSVCACPWPSAVFVDYKAMRISGEKTDTDRQHGSSGTAQGSPLLSRELWSTYERRQRLEKSPSSRVVKKSSVSADNTGKASSFMLIQNAGLSRDTPPPGPDGITSQSSVDPSRYPCGAHSAPAVWSNRRKRVSEWVALQTFACV